MKKQTTPKKKIYCLDICLFETYTHRVYMEATDSEQAIAKFKQLIADFTPQPDFGEVAIIVSDDIAGF